MALNYPGPYVLKIFYVVNVFQHVMNLNLQLTGTPSPGTDFNAITTAAHNGANPDLQTLVDNLIVLLRPFFDVNQTQFTHAELWKIAPNSFDGTFVSSYQIGVAGGNPIAAVGASEMIYVFRSAEGGILKVYMEEVSNAGGPTIPYATMTVNQKALADFFTSQSNPWLARDTSRPVSTIALYPGQNERIFKARNR